MKDLRGKYLLEEPIVAGICLGGTTNRFCLAGTFKFLATAAERIQYTNASGLDLCLFRMKSERHVVL